MRRYDQALRTGYDLVAATELLTNNHILRIQAELEENTAGFCKLPGMALKNSLEETAYTPPQDPATILSLMGGLERFINDDTARQTLGTVGAIQVALQDYKNRIRAGHKFYSQDLINTLFMHPYTKIEFVERDLGVSRLTASKHLEALTAGGSAQRARETFQLLHQCSPLRDIHPRGFVMSSVRCSTFFSGGTIFSVELPTWHTFCMMTCVSRRCADSKALPIMSTMTPNLPTFASPTPCASCHTGGEPTRVLFLNTRDWCGADVAVHLSLIHSFDSRRTRTYLLSNSEAGDADRMRAVCRDEPGLTWQFLPLGVPAERLAGRSAVAKAGAALSIAASLLRAVMYVRHWRIDMIHATDRPRDAAFSTLVARLTGTPNVVHMHSNAGAHLSRATRWGMRHASALFAVSEATRQEMIAVGLPADKIAVVHNATDPAHFDPSGMGDAGMEIRRHLDIPAGAPVIGIVARLNPWKGQRELIEAVAVLGQSHPDLRLLVLGVGEEEEALRRLAAERGLNERVLFIGWKDDVRPYLSALDLFCLPSHAEPFGLAITEAMAMGLPVLACESGGVPEIIEHGRNGWLVPPRLVEELAGALRFLLDDPDLRRVLGRNARQRVEERFTPAQQANLVSHLYTSLTGRHDDPAPIS